MIDDDDDDDDHDHDHDRIADDRPTDRPITEPGTRHRRPMTTLLRRRARFGPDLSGQMLRPWPN